MTSVDDWVKWCRSKGLKDSREYLTGVDAWRRTWRPNRVRVLLVAESHVAEERGDHKVRVKSPNAFPKILPSCYVRLVYCLGYGEDTLCEPPNRSPKSNHGTPQFWELFQALATCEIDEKPVQKGEIMRKLNILRKLQRKRVWLVDACVGALVKPGNPPDERRLCSRRIPTSDQGEL
jgi:hypothetical protein